MARKYREDVLALLPRGKAPWGYEPTLEAVPNLLGSEQARAIAMGKAEGQFAIFVLSQTRVSLLRSTLFGRVSTEDLLLSSITSVEQKKGMMSSLILHASGNDLELGVVDNREAEAFASTVRQAVNDSKGPGLNASVTPPPPTSTPARSSEQIKQAIRDLAELRDEGLLTEAQFEEKKAALLEKL